MSTLTTEGRDYLANAGLTGGAQYAAYYIGLIETDFTEDEGLTMTTLLAAETECTAYTTSGNLRLALTPSALADGLYANTANEAVFEFTAPKTIYGAFITSGNTRSNNGGLLLAIAKFASPKVIDSAGERLNIIGGVQMTVA